MTNWIGQISYSFIFIGKIPYPKDVMNVGALWFFPFLAAVKLIFVLLKKISKNDPIKLFFLVSLVSYIGYVLSTNLLWLPFSLDIALFSISFYYIGYIFGKTNILQKILSF